jgi:hypothetical protein
LYISRPTPQFNFAEVLACCDLGVVEPAAAPCDERGLDVEPSGNINFGGNSCDNSKNSLKVFSSTK